MVEEEITTLDFLNRCGFELNGTSISNLKGQLLDRQLFLNLDLYKDLQIYMPCLRKRYGSSFLTAFHKNADIKQKWPLLNLVRQILKQHNLGMKPIRIAKGYDALGKKKVDRFFQIYELS